MDWITVIVYIIFLVALASTKTWKRFGILVGVYLVFHIILGLIMLPKTSAALGPWMSQAVFLIAIAAGARSGFRSGEEAEEEREEDLKEEFPDKEEKVEGISYQKFLYLRLVLAFVIGFTGISLLGTIFTGRPFIFTPPALNSTVFWNTVGWIIGCFFIGFIIYYPIETLWLKTSSEDSSEKEEE